jgi:hypothetical protein
MTTLQDREEYTTTETTEQGHGSGSTNRTNRTLMAVAIALAVALVGLTAWVIVDRTSTPETAPSDDVAQVWNDYQDAWNNYDGDAFLQVVTSDFTFVTEQGITDGPDQAASINNLGQFGWQVTPIGERIMAGDGPWYVTQMNHVELAGSSTADGLTVLTIVDDGGVLRVQNHTFFGDL